MIVPIPLYSPKLELNFALVTESSAGTPILTELPNAMMKMFASAVGGFENVISYPYTISNDEPAKYVFKQASQSGKIALSFESGKLGYVQKESVDRIKRGYYRIFNKLYIKSHPIIFEIIFYV